MQIKVIVKGEEIKMSRKEYMKKYGKDKHSGYDDKMIRNEVKR